MTHTGNNYLVRYISTLLLVCKYNAGKCCEDESLREFCVEMGSKF